MSYRLPALPSRIDRDEELELVQRAQAGEQQARDALVLNAVPACLRVASRWRTPSMPLADLVHEGIVGVLKAIDTFDAADGTPFMGYAFRALAVHIRDAAGRSCLIRPPKDQVQRRRYPREGGRS